MSESKTKCLARTLSDVHDEFSKEWTDKKMIQEAYDRCGSKKEDFAEDFCPYHLLAKERFSKTFLNNLPTDFTPVPKSIMISKAVNQALPILAKQFTEYSEVDLLKMAYQLAQDSLSVNDFETIEEHPVYFAIQIPGEQMALFEAELRTAAYYLDDFTNDNLYKIHPFKLSDVHPSVRFRKDDLEEEKLRFFERVLDKDPKNLAPILIDEDGMIWDGHHRYYALKRLKEKQIFAVQLPTHLLKKLEDFTIMAEWDYNKDANFNITNFDTKLNRLFNTLADFTEDVAPFFAPDVNVSSSNVAEIGYDRNKLRILFKNGGGYEYDVPSSFYAAMMSASSKGKFVWETLRGKTPGRVIDKPSKMTPGGVGGSLVPYFKVRKAQMSQAQMASSVRTFLRAVKKGTTKVGGELIQQIDKPTFKQFDKFVKGFQSPKEKLRSFFSRFIPSLRTDFTHHYTNDFVEDMRHFRGPISRAGPFDYDGIIKYKNLENLAEQAQQTNHLPVFGTHGEDQIIAFTYNLTDDPDIYMKDHKDYDSFKDEPYIYGEGYLLDGEIEDLSTLPIISDETKLPVSIKFEDANEGSGNADQQITSLVHLAMSVNATEQDRCSTVNGKSCWVSFTTDFIPQEELNMAPPKKKTKKDMAKEKDDSPEEEQDDGEEEDSDMSDDPKETDEEQSTESTGKHSKGDMVEISKKELDQLQDMKKNVDGTFKQLKLDFKKAVKDEVADFKKELKQNQDFKEMKKDFSDSNKIYKISADFEKTATYDDMAVLKRALVEHEEDFDPSENLGFGSSKTGKPQSDFAKRIDADRAAARKEMGLGY